MNTAPRFLHDTLEGPWMPLDPDAQEIRILRLAPGDYDDDLVFSLHTASLADRPEYDALSYVWGEQLAPCNAIVNRYSVSIGLFLDTALRHLRRGKGEEVRVLWVDALCINQTNTEERIQQVQHMKEIYSYARKVLIWLGPAQPGDDLVLGYVERERESIPETERELMRSFRALEEICRRPWFGRVWVVQEVVLAKQDPQLHFGRRTASWTAFYNFVSWIHKHADHKNRWPVKGYDRVFPLWAATKGAVKIGRAREAWLAAAYSTRQLVDQLIDTVDCDASDPRDKVFGLLGITVFSPNQIAIIPDYSMSTSEVFTRATWSMIHAHTCPHHWFSTPSMHTAVSPQAHAVRDFPSWVCDFTINLRTPSTLGRDAPYTLLPPKAHPLMLSLDLSYLPPCSRVSNDCKTLTTMGAYIGTIAETTGDLLGLDDAISASVWKRIFDEFLEPRHISANKLSDAASMSAEFTVEIIDAFVGILKGDIQDWPSGSLGYEALVNFSPAKDKILFVTNQGDVGITYHPDLANGVRPGDIVVGLFGVNYPFILRLVPGAAGVKPTYTMINVAHVANHVWGHVFVQQAAKDVRESGAEPPPWLEFKKFGLEEYTIV